MFHKRTRPKKSGRRIRDEGKLLNQGMGKTSVSSLLKFASRREKGKKPKAVGMM